MTHEQFVVYLDAAVERVEEAAESRIQEIRTGTILAHDKKASDKWNSRKRSRTPAGRGMVGAALEAAVAGIASLFPGNVVKGTA